jgi:hypothetical protein
MTTNSTTSHLDDEIKQKKETKRFNICENYLFRLKVRKKNAEGDFRSKWPKTTPPLWTKKKEYLKKDERIFSQERKLGPANDVEYWKVKKLGFNPKPMYIA